MGDNYLKQQIQNFKKRHDRAMADVIEPDLFRRAETVSTIFSAQPDPGQAFQPGEDVYVAVQPDGEVAVIRGHVVIGTIKGDGADKMRQFLNGTGIGRFRVSEVSSISGTAKLKMDQ